MKNIVTFENFDYKCDEINEGLFSKKPFKERFDAKAEEMKKYITEKKGDVAKLSASANWAYQVMAAMVFGTPYAKYNSSKNAFIPIGGTKSAGGSNFHSGKTKEELQKKYPEYTEVVKTQGEKPAQTQGQVQERIISSFSNFKI